MSDTEFDVVIAVLYDRSKACTVDDARVSAVKKSVASVGGHGANALQAAITDAQQR